MSVDTQNTIIRSFKGFFYGTFLSRISGLLRDISMAFFFGAGSSIAAFMVAFRFANLFRRLFGESNITGGFVPFFENLRLTSPKKAAMFYRDLFFSILVLLMLLVVASEIIFHLYLKFSISESFNNIIYLTSLMLPGLIFICLYALNSALLQCNKRYFLPAVAPVFFNLVWILCVVLFRNNLAADAIRKLSVGIVIAFLFQYLTTLRASIRFFKNDLSLKDWFLPKLFSKEIRQLTKPILLGILGISAMQINSALDAIFAKIADDRGPAYLWYAIRLYQMPIALFAIALSSSLLPPLTRAYRENSFEKYKSFLNTFFTKSLSLMIPITIAIFTLGAVSVNLIYARGIFDIESINQTIYCLWGYGLGLVFATLVMILANCFFAKKQYFEPAIASIISVGVNISLNFIFIYFLNLKTTSIAISTSISSLCNFLILLHFLKKQNPNIIEKSTISSFVKPLLCSLLAAVLTLSIGYYIKDPTLKLFLGLKVSLLTGFYQQLSSFIILSSVYFLSLFSFAYIFKVKDLLVFFKKTYDN